MPELHIRMIQPKPKPEKRPSRKNALALWLIAFFGMLAPSLLASFFPNGSIVQDPFVELLIENLIYYLPFVVLPLLVLAKRRPGLSESYRLGPLPFSSMLLIVALGVLTMFFVNDITVLWAIPFEGIGMNPYINSIPVATNTRELMLNMLSVAVIPAVCEELLFRGAILPALEGYGTKRAMVLSSLLFMALHMSITGAPSEFIGGMVMASVVFSCDSIYAGITCHTVFNAAALLLEYAQNSAAVATQVSTLTLLEAIGGFSGVLSLLLNIAISWLLIRAILNVLRLRGRLSGIVEEPRKRQALSRGELVLLVLVVAVCVLGYAGVFAVMRGIWL